MKQRIISLLLVVCILVAIVPTTAIEAQAATPTIQGKTIDTMGRPVPAMVSAYLDGESSPLATTIANESTGEFVLSRSGGFEDGNYTIKAEYPICVPTTIAIPLSSSDGFIVAAPITMKLVGRASGTVTDASTGTGLSGVTVSVYTTSGSLMTSTTTSTGGKYKIETEQGSYNIEFSHSGYITGRLENVTLGVIETTHDMQLTSGSGGVTPGEIVASGKFGVTWILYSNGLLVFSGNGSIGDNSVSNRPGWFEWKDSIKSVVIEKGVTSIGLQAFVDCTSLTCITIPDSVTRINSSTFSGCTSLTSVEIPNSVTSIGWGVFRQCTSLTNVTIPNSVTSLDYSTFSHCTSLTSITIPDSVTSIGDHTFWGCTSLTSITIPDSVTSIGNSAFWGCTSLTSITIPNNVTSIGDGTFWGCTSLTSITIPDRVTRVFSGAFVFCANLKDVHYGGTEEQWKKISIALWNNDLTSATIHCTDGDILGTGTPTPTASPSPKPTPSNNTKLQSLASKWETAYGGYSRALKQRLAEIAKTENDPNSLDELAKRFENRLGKQYGLELDATNFDISERVLVYKAILEMMSEYSGSEALKFNDISTGNLNKFSIEIANRVARAFQTTSYQYIDTANKGTKVNINLIDFGGGKLGEATIVRPGKYSKTTSIISSFDNLNGILTEYMDELVNLEEVLAKKAAKEIYQDLTTYLFGKSLDKISKAFLEKKLSQHTPRFLSMGLGDVSKAINDCCNYYQFLENVSNMDTDDLMLMLEGVKDISFNDPSVTDNVIKQALEDLETLRKSVEQTITGESTEKDSFWWDLLKGSILYFKCPVSVAVYDSTGSQIGYVGDDDLWYKDSVYIEKNGDVKTVYSNGFLSFKITGTDYGTLNCTYEEYENGAATRRINYYDIPIETGKELTADISEDGNSLLLREVGGQTISANETVPAADYSKATVTISAKADGGSVQGAGKFVRGDFVQLMAFPDDGYNFIGWQDNDGALIEISTLYEFTAKEDTTLTAVFAKALDSAPTTTPTPTPTSSPTPATPTPSPIPTSSPTPTPNSKHPFIDVKGNAWYAQAVQYVYENGLMAGVSSTTFSPNSTTTRGQLVTILYRAEGGPEVNETVKFNDVPAGKWYSKAVSWASENGIVSGYGNGRFGPNDSVTREQMVTILYRYAQSKQIDTEKEADLSSYTDYKKISTYAVAPMQWAVAEGFISGTSKTTLSPIGTSTRAQIAVVLKRYQEKFAGSVE